MNMRLDYILYVLAALLLILTVVPFVVTIEGVESDERNLWVIASILFGLLSLGLGYSQRPKTTAQACQPAATMTQQTIPTAAEAAQEATKIPEEKAVVKTTPSVVTHATKTMEPTQLKGISEKRAEQLKALGIKNIADLVKASPITVAKKLRFPQKSLRNGLPVPKNSLSKNPLGEKTSQLQRQYFHYIPFF